MNDADFLVVLGEGHDLLLDLKAHKEKLMREEITITSVLDVNKSLTISLHSRVLGKRTGENVGLSEFIIPDLKLPIFSCEIPSIK